VATAERAVGPRKGAINDGEAEAATEPGLASNEGRRGDVRLRVELVPFYRHALPMRTARPESM
jgi:hypothetical protein